MSVMGEERENMVAAAAAAVDLGPYPADPGPRDAIFCDVISRDAISHDVISCFP